MPDTVRTINGVMTDASGVAIPGAKVIFEPQRPTYTTNTQIPVNRVVVYADETGVFSVDLICTTEFIKPCQYRCTYPTSRGIAPFYFDLPVGAPVELSVLRESAHPEITPPSALMTLLDGLVAAEADLRVDGDTALSDRIDNLSAVVPTFPDVTGVISDTQHGSRSGGTLHAAATDSVAGFISAADKTKLDGIAAGSTVNSTDAFLLGRANHTGVQLAATISDFNTAVDARISYPVLSVNTRGGAVVLTSSDVGLGNVDNVSNATLLASSGFNAAADARADGRIALLVNSAPSTLDTLRELADALGDDPNFATTTTTLIGTKLAKASNLSDLTDASAARTNLTLGNSSAVTFGSISTGVISSAGADPSTLIAGLGVGLGSFAVTYLNPPHTAQYYAVGGSAYVKNTGAPLDVEVYAGQFSVRIDGANTGDLNNATSGICAIQGAWKTVAGATGTNNLMVGCNIAMYPAAAGMTVNNAIAFKLQELVGNGVVVNATAYWAPKLTYATNNAQMVFGASAQPAGNWSIYDVSGYPSLFSGLVTVNPASTSAKAIVAQGLASQTGNLIEAQSSAGAAFFAVGPPTLLGDGTQSWLRVAGTLPSVLTTGVVGVDVAVTGAGSSASAPSAQRIQLLAGYTGSGTTSALSATNFSLGTGADFVAGSYNAAIIGSDRGTTTGDNVGLAGIARDGDFSVGVAGKSIVNKASAVNMGVAGLAQNTSGAAVQIGGYFTLRATKPLLSQLASAGLYASNGSTTSPIFLGVDNTTTVFTIFDGGDVTSTGYIKDAGSAYVTAQFDKTNDAALANIPGLSVTLAAGTAYSFKVLLFININAFAGGQVALSGTCTASDLRYTYKAMGGGQLFDAQRLTVLNNALSVSSDDEWVEFEGTILVNAAGTFTVQIAEAVAVAATSASALTMSSMTVKRM